MEQARLTFPGISSAAWEHPADRAALTALRAVPGLDAAIQFFFGQTGERAIRLAYLASSVRVGPKQFARLDSLLGEACKVFDVATPPELFVSQSPQLNAMAVGMNRPFIVLNSALAETMTDEETIAVLAHELGHILSGHVLYKTLLMLLLQVTTSAIPAANIVLFGLIAALKEWNRKSELSADRAELLATQNTDISLHLLMRLAGGNHLNEMSLEEFIKQGEEYEAASTVPDNLFKILNTWGNSHPYAVVRVAELRKWSESAEYKAILNGDYPRGTRPDLGEDLGKTAKGYGDDFAKTTQPLGKAFSEAAESVAETLKSLFK